MTFSASDFRQLQTSLIVLILMTILGGATIVISRDRMRAADIAFRVALAERRDFDGKLRRAHGEEDEIRQKAAVLQQLSARGVFGQEQRLEWVELLKEINDRYHLIDMRYECAPQRALGASGTLGLYASAMTLQTRLLHEGDLIRLLDELREQAPALIQVRRCDLMRLPGGGNALQEGNLQADCLIDWVTLHAE